MFAHRLVLDANLRQATTAVPRYASLQLNQTSCADSTLQVMAEGLKVHWVLY